MAAVDGAGSPMVSSSLETDDTQVYARKWAEKLELENGFKVLMVNDGGARTVYLRLVVKVGSLDEQDEEKGFAHFVEHLGFRGTLSHENGSLQKFFETNMGTVFGADLNAKTGLSETIWMMNVPVTDSPECAKKLQESLTIMSEWGCEIRISDQDVEAERKIIEEEYRMKRGSAQRIKDRYWELVMPRIYDRLPIGTLESIRTASREGLRRFYETHYTFDRMGLVVVGNLSCIGGAQGLANYIESSSLFRSQRDQIGGAQVERVPMCLPKREPFFCVLKDKELQVSTMLCMEIYDNIRPSSFNNFVKHELVKRLFISIVEARFRELSSRPHTQQEGSSAAEAHSPWISAGVATRLAFHEKPIECTSFTAQAHVLDMEPQEAIRLAVQGMVREVIRIHRHGFSRDELNFAKQKWHHVFMQRLTPSSKDSLCESISEELVQHFLLDEQTPLMNPEEEVKMALRMLGNGSKEDDMELTITEDDVWQHAKALVSSFVDFSASDQTNIAFVLQGKYCGDLEDHDFAAMVQHALALSMDSQREDVCPWKFTPPLESLEDLKQALLPFHCHTLAAKANPKYIEMLQSNCGTFLLKNGIKVCIKNTSEIHQDRISFQAFALGGSANLNAVEDAAFSLLNGVIHASGLGMLHELEISKVESVHRTSVRLQHHWFHRGIGGSCPANRFELLLQMIVSWLLGLDSAGNRDERKKLDPHAFDRYRRIALDGIRNSKELKVHSPDLVFAEEIRKMLFGDEEPLTAALSEETIAQVTLDLIEDLYFDAFIRNPTEFTFVFTGDFSLFKTTEEIGELLNVYLGEMLAPSPGRSKWWGPEIQRPRKLDLSFPKDRLIHMFRFSEPEKEELQEKEEEREQSSVSTNDGKAQVLIGYRVDAFEKLQVELDIDLKIRCACMLAQIRLLEQLRTKQNLIYSIGVEQSRNSLSPIGFIFITCSCRGDNAENIVTNIFNMIDQFGHENAAHPPLDLQAVVNQLKTWQKNALRSNSHWLFWLLDSFKRAQTALDGNVSEEKICEWVDQNVSQVTDEGLFESRVNTFLEHVDRSFKEYFRSNHGCGIVMLPQKPLHKL